MATKRISLFLAAFLSLSFGVLSQSCASYGVDYSNGGSYYIDKTSNQYFSFATVFQGCTQETISPVLADPDNNQYACSDIETGQSGRQVVSTCGIPFSAMRSGQWKIIIAGRQIAVQRTINLNVGAPETTTVTATPTVVIGITSTPRAITVISTIIQTQTLILTPATTTRECNNGQTQTVTVYASAPTVTIQSTVLRTSTAGQVTRLVPTTVLTTARCYFTRRPDVAGVAAAMAATTITVTQTTATVTRTSITTVPTPTTTEAILKISTQTITPAPLTVCTGGNRPGATVTVRIGNTSAVTRTNIVYVTTTISGTVFVGSTVFSTVTNAASATACWRSGGRYGR